MCPARQWWSIAILLPAIAPVTTDKVVVERQAVLAFLLSVGLAPSGNGLGEVPPVLWLLREGMSEDEAPFSEIFSDHGGQISVFMVPSCRWYWSS